MNEHWSKDWRDNLWSPNSSIDDNEDIKVPTTKINNKNTAKIIEKEYDNMKTSCSEFKQKNSIMSSFVQCEAKQGKKLISLHY